MYEDDNDDDDGTSKEKCVWQQIHHVEGWIVEIFFMFPRPGYNFGKCLLYFKTKSQCKEMVTGTVRQFWELYICISTWEDHQAS